MVRGERREKSGPFPIDIAKKGEKKARGGEERSAQRGIRVWSIEKEGGGKTLGCSSWAQVEGKGREGI